MEKLLTTLRSLLLKFDDNVAIINQDGTILHATVGTRMLLGQDQLVGKSIFDFIDGPKDLIQDWLKKVDETHFQVAGVCIHADGQKIPARISIVAWNTENNERVMLVSIKDTTLLERRRRDLLRKALTIETLSRSSKIRKGKLHDAVYEILELSARSVRVGRVNAWLFSEDGSRLDCIGNYDLSENSMIPQESLPTIDTPEYFDAFTLSKIIVADDARNNYLTRELTDSYLLPNNIYSLMDIPLRIEGKIVGVICFESVGEYRRWKLEDQKFGLIAAQMVSLAIETWQRKIAQHELEQVLHRQQQLVKETEHRIKNNLAIVSSLIRLQMSKAKDNYHKALFEEIMDRVTAVSSLHGVLQMNSDTHRVSIRDYIDAIVTELKKAHAATHPDIQILTTIQDISMSSSSAVSVGMIISEAVSNAYKHGFKANESGAIRIHFDTSGPTARLSVSDTGSGSENIEGRDGSGLDIIQGMAEHLDGDVRFSGKAGFSVEVMFKMK